MEKIRVNMTPCEEVKTIHASQNDNATRKWAFGLYDENGKIDSSDIKEQMIFDSRVGGTEQILPENTSNPTTSPIIADIQYPDSLRSEQTFLYRESPNTVDGQSKIIRIKGNTLVWNQLVENGNFADATGWQTGGGATLSVANNKASINAVGINSSLRTSYELDIRANHKYIISFYVTATVDTTETRARLYKSVSLDNYGDAIALTANDKTRYLAMITPSTSSGRVLYIYPDRSVTFNGTLMIEDVMLIDLTQMGLDTLTVDQFTSLFSLPYYAHTSGKLLPFKGEELKTTNADETETNVLSLPTLTYFPSGMKSAGSAYDEQLPDKATTRVGSITFDGTQSITTSSINSSRCKAFFAAPNVAPNTSSNTIDYETISSYLPSCSNALTQAGESGVHRRANGSSEICISLGVSAYNSGITTNELFLQYLAEHPLTVYYELATPTEESITTASLVTEKGETPLYYDDELIADCNETISSESGIFDAKIKLMDDETVYSQKIQLHVERKP